MSSGVVLMYHALWSNEDEFARIAPEERPYAVHADSFAEQIDYIAGQRELADTLVTFDDGHASCCSIARPILERYGMSATLFVTSGWFGRRKDFCGPDEVALLIDAGWKIGAHGHTHRFLTGLPDVELADELRRSAECLQEYVSGEPSMSFPGGRFGKRELDVARKHGFVEFFGSRPARRNPRGDVVVPRIAIRNATKIESFRRMLSPHWMSGAAALSAYYSKQFARVVLGDKSYHRAYRFLKG